MKTTSLHNWTVVCSSLLMAAAIFRASADEQPTATAKPGETYTDTVASVEPKERTLAVKGLVRNKAFNIGDNCAFTYVDKGAGTISGLRPGQKVMVSYRNANGVLVANHIDQKPLLHEGTVKAVDPEKRTVTLHHR